MEYEGRLRKSEWEVRPIDLYTARRLVEKWHYAKSATNTGVYTFGLFKKEDSFFETNCYGVSWWLPPTKNAAIATYPEGDWQKVLSLTRLVISPNVPKNACSFLLSRSMKMIDNKKWECLVTYADTWRNHTGSIYKASNWEYMGLTNGNPVFVNDKGKMMGRKRASKNYTKDELLTMGFDEVGIYPKHKFRKIIKNGI